MTTPSPPYRADVLFAGGGVSALVAALELVEAGRRVLILEGNPRARLGGQARDAFGGFFLVDSPEQRRAGVRDDAALAWADWQSYAEFGPDSALQQRWAQRYIERCLPDVRDWLLRRGLRFFPLPAWAERHRHGRGNRVPRFHLLWGCGAGLVARLLTLLAAHEGKHLSIACDHRVDDLIQQGGRVIGVRGRAAGQPFEAYADQVVVSGGGITGNLALVRQHWPSEWGEAPTELLNGSYPEIDGQLHQRAAALGAELNHLEHMWTYAAGIRHWRGQHPEHGLAVVPPRSALWLQHDGARFSPPLMGGFDTRALVTRITNSGRPWSWLLLNRRILERELAIQGATFNPAFRNRNWWQLVHELLFGQQALSTELLTQCPDAVSAPDLATLVQRMNALTPAQPVSLAAVTEAIAAYDGEIARGPRFFTDEQLLQLRSIRAFPGDRLRTCKFQPILDPGAGPLVALRLRLLSRKSLGGIVTDGDCRVLDRQAQPIPGLYAIGEAAGFGGGGMNGKRTLEGTLLGGCVFTARAFAHGALS